MLANVLFLLVPGGRGIVEVPLAHSPFSGDQKVFETMTTITHPTLQNRLLDIVSDEIDAQPALAGWTYQTVKIFVSLAEALTEYATEWQSALEAELADGVEARSFARRYAGELPKWKRSAERLETLVERLAPATTPPVLDLKTELSRAKIVAEAVRDLLSETLRLATEQLRPIDLERVRASEEAHARGETKPFSGN
jgi:hypothetical protein